MVRAAETGAARDFHSASQCGRGVYFGENERKIRQQEREIQQREHREFPRELG